MRAKRDKVPFSLSLGDVPEVPEFCPVLGIPLDLEGGQKENSPSLDKIIPRLGYVPGNVQIISQRANRIKYDASAEELELVANYIRKAQLNGLQFTDVSNSKPFAI